MVRRTASVSILLAMLELKRWARNTSRRIQIVVQDGRSLTFSRGGTTTILLSVTTHRSKYRKIFWSRMISKWFAYYVAETRRKDGSEYPSKTILQRHRCVRAFSGRCARKTDTRKVRAPIMAYVSINEQLYLSMKPCRRCSLLVRLTRTQLLLLVRRKPCQLFSFLVQCTSNTHLKKFHNLPR